MSVLELLRLVRLVAPAATAQPTLVLDSATIQQVPGVQVPLRGAGAGLVRSSTTLARTLNITVSGSARPASGATGPHTVIAGGRGLANRDLTGSIGYVTPLSSGGAFSAKVDLIFSGEKPPPRRFELHVDLDDGGMRVARRSVTFELLDIAGFAAIMDAYERRWSGPPGATSADFIAAPRKVLLPSGDFEIVLGRHAPIAPLFPRGTPSADWLKDGWGRVLAGGEVVEIGHTLIGVEGADRFRPEPKQQVPRIDLLVVWAGDLGSVLRDQAYDRFLLPVAKPPTLQQSMQKRAGREELMADIDGVNLAAAYDESIGLGDNLRSFYGALPRYRRMSDFLVNTKRDDGSPALTLQTGVSPPKLTPASRQWIAEQVSLLGSLLTLALIVRDKRITKKTPPQAVSDLFLPTSPQMQQVVGWFVDLIEAGLAAEAGQ